MPCRIDRDFSSTSSESLLTSGENTPTTIGQSIFAKQAKIDLSGAKPFSAIADALPQHQRQPEKYYTPVLGKKKVDLYKLSIIQMLLSSLKHIIKLMKQA